MPINKTELEVTTIHAHVFINDKEDGHLSDLMLDIAMGLLRVGMGDLDSFTEEHEIKLPSHLNISKPSRTVTIIVKADHADQQEAAD